MDAPDARLSGLMASIGAQAAVGPAPVHLWNPPFCGEIAMRIAADGSWFYAGTPIERPAMVRLFARILRRDSDRYVLVTPVERVGLEVEDAPFVAAAMERRSGELRFATNVGDEVEVGADHGLRFEVERGGGIKPYVHVRGGLWARLTRGVAMELLQTLEEMPEGLAVRSGDRLFPIPSQGTEDLR